MAFIEGSNDGALNGTTPVDAVAAPAASTRRVVKNVVVHNKDTASVIVTLTLVNGGNTRRLHRQTLPSDSTLVYEVVTVLDTTSKKLQLVLSGAPTTTQPDFSTAFADAT